ncbi:ABC-2 family transporter protein [Candidatus Woesearchaeota archaeon]|nr:ABC-2 family transporter protein [Candidatus Woesearchaeota archaeon]
MNMKKYAGIVKFGLKTGLAYRFEFILSIFTIPLSLLVYYFLWRSIFEYSGQTVIQGFTFEAMITYYTLSMIVGFFTWTNIEKWIEYDLIAGEMVINLLRPMDFLHANYFFELGMKIFSLITQAIPIYLIGLIFFSLKLTTFLNLCLFIISLILASLIFFMMSYLIGILAFWMKRISGISKAKRPLITFLGGGILPLSFFPETAQYILYFLPFQYVRYIPISIYLGKFSLTSALALIGVQLAWVVVLYLFAIWLWKRAFQKFMGEGV